MVQGIHKKSSHIQQVVGWEKELGNNTDYKWIGGDGAFAEHL